MNGKTRTLTLAQASRAALLAAAAFGITACGGGGGSVGGIDRLGVSSGQVTGFGSIYVNGVEWETSRADIVIDDNPGTESDLRVGQVVIVQGQLSADGTRGTADTVTFDCSVEGPIASINLAAGTFVVLGQTVIVSADTAFDDSFTDRVADGRRTLDDLQAGDLVEVSGFRNAAGATLATRVEPRVGGGEYEVKGVVSALGASTFQLGTLVVDYAGATLSDFGSDTLSNGDYVEVKGTLAGATLEASEVQREDSLPGGSGDRGELEGLVTRYASATDFDVNGVRVTTDGGTRYEDGTAANLALNARVEVKGEINASGVLVADEIEFRLSAGATNVEIEGFVDTVNAAAGTFTVEGMGVTVRVNAGTRLEDKSDADINNFSLANLASGDYVEVIGGEDATTGAANDVIATRLERDDADNEVTLRGPVQAESQPEITILGVTVATDSAVFRDLDDDPINEATFFATIGVGDVVKAKGGPEDLIGGNQFVAEEVEIEDLD